MSPLLHRLLHRVLHAAIVAPWLRLRCLWLHWTIYETEGYLAACARDGLTDSLSLREFRAQVCAMRVQLALLEARISTRRALRAPAPHHQEAA